MTELRRQGLARRVPIPLLARRGALLIGAFVGDVVTDFWRQGIARRVLRRAAGLSAPDGQRQGDWYVGFDLS